MKKKTITICGKKVKMLYCTATETGFENLADKKISVFYPQPVTDENGNPMLDENGKQVWNEPAAGLDDFVKLAIAAIIAAYSVDDKEPPVTGKQIMYKAPMQEVQNMITAVDELRREWYHVPAVMKSDSKKDDKEEEDATKN